MTLITPLFPWALTIGLLCPCVTDPPASAPDRGRVATASATQASTVTPSPTARGTVKLAVIRLVRKLTTTPSTMDAATLSAWLIRLPARSSNVSAMV